MKLNHTPAGAGKTRISRIKAGVVIAALALALSAPAALPAEASTVLPADGLTYGISAGELITSDFAIVVDLANGRVIAGKNQDVPMYPASMTKVMTLLVACEHLTDLTAPVVISQDAIDYAISTGLSRVGFTAGETVTVADLLYGTILPSGAEAAIMLGRYVAGSDEAFVALMNQKAAELGLSTTHFANCTGITDASNYTTCSDMAAILQAATQNSIAWTVLTTRTYTTTPTVQHPSGINVTNLFLQRIGSRTLPGICFAAKTGYTSAAGCCAASWFVSWTGHPYICVTAHTGTAMQAVADHEVLYDTFSNATFESALNTMLASIGYPGAAADTGTQAAAAAAAE